MDEQIDAAQARDHIEMVQRILEESQQRLCAGGDFFVVWGLYSGLATLDWVLIDKGVWPVSTLWAQGALLVAAIVYSVIRGRALATGVSRQSLVQREFFNMLWLTLGLAFIMNVAAFNVFAGVAQAAIWSFAEAVVLFFIGLHGNRRAQFFGIVMIASIVAANFADPSVRGYVLAAGMIAGYGGFGVAELLSRE